MMLANGVAASKPPAASAVFLINSRRCIVVGFYRYKDRTFLAYLKTYIAARCITNLAVKAKSCIFAVNQGFGL